MTLRRSSGQAGRQAGILVLKLGGELIETADTRARIAPAIAALARTRPLIIVHGGGQAIDAELVRRGIAPKKVDGLRVTDAGTLAAVVAVLAGTANTDLVASLVGAGVRAVGLTGVDAGCGRARRARSFESTSGAFVDLGLVGDPSDVNPALFELLMTQGYVPVVASVGLDASCAPGAERGSAPAQILNVNADVMACRIAIALGASELIIAGTTAGVLDGTGHVITALDCAEASALIGSGVASVGMIAKLRACVAAIEEGVAAVRIVDGRAMSLLSESRGTTLTADADHTPVRVAAVMNP